MLADARAAGMDEASLAALRGDLEGDEAEGLLPVNLPVIRAWLTACGTQWRTGSAGMGRLVWIGLDYAGVRVGLEAQGIAVTPALWGGLQVMEQAAIAALNME